MDVRAQRQQAADHSMAEAVATGRRDMNAGSQGGGILKKVLMGLAALVAVVILGWFANKAYAAMADSGAVKSKQYQALFLTNGQVYFGKLTKVDSSYVKLTDIFYLQVQQTVQPKDSSASSANNQQVSLAKLGGELHGPEDVMYVSRQQVLFWENLKDDGKVVKAISAYKAGGQK